MTRTGQLHLVSARTRRHEATMSCLYYAAIYGPPCIFCLAVLQQMARRGRSRPSLHGALLSHEPKKKKENEKKRGRPVSLPTGQAHQLGGGGWSGRQGGGRVPLQRTAASIGLAASALCFFRISETDELTTSGRRSYVTPRARRDGERRAREGRVEREGRTARQGKCHVRGDRPSIREGEA